MSSMDSPRYLEISRKIEARIASGLWSGDGRIPGVREIAEEHKVSVVTASRALQVLRDKGIIKSVERSGSFLVREAVSSDERWALCFRVTPGPWQKASYSITMAGFEALARREGLSFSTDAIVMDEEGSARDLGRQVRQAVASGIKGLFFLPSRIDEKNMRQDEQLLLACREHGLPVVFIERNLRGDARPLEWDLVGPDDFEGGVRCTQHLYEIGRKRVAFVQGCPTSSHNDRLSGYLFAHFRAQGARNEAPIVLEFRHDLPGKQAYSMLADRVIQAGTDGVICFQDITAIGLIMELLARGKRIPHDFALTGFDDLPIGNSFSIGVTTYALDAESVTIRAVRAMKERIAYPDAAPVRVVVPGTLLVRESSTGVNVISTTDQTADEPVVTPSLVQG